MTVLELTKAEGELLREACLTWLTLLANDQEGDFSEAIDITLAAGEIVKINKKEMDDILARG